MPPVWAGAWGLPPKQSKAGGHRCDPHKDELEGPWTPFWGPTEEDGERHRVPCENGRRGLQTAFSWPTKKKSQGMMLHPRRRWPPAEGELAAKD
ncbi:hypothetical protein NDU88_007316 [Pleurodeles waltl]|uniref:Uncharacterized protein n=1 Tax=Pleurodeles waltl TaxID=8319 RepID=A0AAV7NSR4_PLEWA|nr:hypothetical protein NDU88_007316 [Pleurodeles waltl]